ncbi:PadR family transcriptional regulator [Aminipila butyrica]|uniref:PadR family transcriptional regulator n=1 Tax=Aminipila butyrica TaxID=433296 RepID=A0A858BZ78_9FIRM|nr:PadR family transcriptional regulator [Aminipila butyrica]QIB70539.1 PadR family transcriptional regulator [Aminipila butyrica]
MSSIDLVILGMLLEKPQSAYDLQKDVEYHHLSRWTKISVPSIYKKVLQLKEKGYLQSQSIKGNKLAEKVLYTITKEGKEYFDQLMNTYAEQQISFLFDFNVVIANLNKMEKNEALVLIEKLQKNICLSTEKVQSYEADYTDIPLVAKTIFEQQRRLYHCLSQWLDHFHSQFKGAK